MPQTHNPYKIRRDTEIKPLDYRITITDALSPIPDPITMRSLPGGFKDCFQDPIELPNVIFIQVLFTSLSAL